MGEGAREVQDRPEAGDDRDLRELCRGEPPWRGRVVHGVCRERLHPGGPGLRAPHGRRHGRQPLPDEHRGRRAQGNVRGRLEQPAARGGRDRRGHRPAGDPLPREPAGARVLPHALPPVPRLHGGPGGPHQARTRLREVRRVEQALRLPEGRRRGRHPQAREVQGLHHRRLGGLGQDLRGACSHQVLRGAQRSRARAVPQAPERTGPSTRGTTTTATRSPRTALPTRCSTTPTSPATAG